MSTITSWLRERDRRFWLAAAGVGAILIALVVLLMLPGDPAPQVVDPVNGAAGVPGGAPPADGTVVADESPPVLIGTAVNVSGADGDAGVAIGEAMEAAMNGGDVDRGWKDDGSGTTRASDAVERAGLILQQVASAYRTCVRTAAAQRKDARRCGSKITDGVRIVSWMDLEKQNLSMKLEASDGTVLWFSLVDGSECRSIDDGDDCAAWGND